MVNRDGLVKSLTVFQENTANTDAAMHSIIHAPVKDFCDTRAASA